MKSPFYHWENTTLLGIRTKLVLCLFLIYPTLKADESISFSRVFEKDGLKCTTEYTITDAFPIEIKRTYKDGNTDRLIIKNIDSKDAQALHQLVKSNKKHLERYLPCITNNLSQNVETTKLNIANKRWRTNDKRPFTLGIFLKTQKNEQASLIGQVGIHSFGNYKSGSVEGMYWIGASHQRKGIASTAIMCLFDYVIANEMAKYVNIAMKKNNSASQQIAIRFRMKAIPDKDKECYAYSLSAKEWKEKHWHKTKLLPSGSISTNIPNTSSQNGSPAGGIIVFIIIATVLGIGSLLYRNTNKTEIRRKKKRLEKKKNDRGSKRFNHLV